MAGFINAVGSAIDSIKLNTISKEMRDGRAMWIKRRRVGSLPIITVANCFFRLSRNPISIWRTLENWQRWEMNCFRTLNGDDFLIFPEGNRTICAEQLPGRNLSLYLNEGSLTKEMMHAAGVELRRVHGIWCSEFQREWSHGDPHLGNLIYDENSGRVRLIDFEVMHYRNLTAQERHVEDVMVVLQDLIGRVKRELWLDLSLGFLGGYNSEEIFRLVKQRLVIPHGMQRVWWMIRTTYMGSGELRDRIEALRTQLP